MRPDASGDNLLLNSNEVATLRRASGIVRFAAGFPDPFEPDKVLAAAAETLRALALKYERTSE